jgi:aldehyde:ferredoxin oxidoreductase
MAKPSSIVVSGSRVVGRCGLGAVMGSKNLKAIAVKGSGSIKIHDPDRFMDAADSVSRRIRRLKGAPAMVTYGTLIASPVYNKLSALTFKNYEDDHIPDEHLRKISHEAFHGIEVDRYACASCPLPCSHVYTIDAGPYAGTRCHKAEANSVWNFGGRLAMDDINGILKAQEECCQLGLDIDNTSGAIAWAIDCYQNGLISMDDTDGLVLDWGDHGAVIELIRKIAFRTGFGNILAEGTFKASQILGKGSDRYAFHIKGQDLIEGIRSMKGWALGVVVSPRGAAHTRGALATERSKWSESDSWRTFGTRTAGIATTYDDKAKALMYMERANAVWDALGICLFTVNRSDPEGINPDELALFYSMATGIPISEKELMKTGERLHTLEKLFNIHHAGFTRKDDYPPKRLMEEPIKSGPLKGERLLKEDWDRLLDDYYDCHKWDKQTSWPTREILKSLGLEEVLGNKSR